MQINFIPIDYDYFDFQGRNFVKIVGRDDTGKRVCIIDSCDVYLWAILKDKLSKAKIEKIVSKVEKIKLDVKGRNTRVEKVEVLDKKYLDKQVKALKVYATNYKDLHDIADKLHFDEIIKRRGYDLGYVTHYIIEKKLNPMNWYKVSGEVLNNSLEFGGIDSVLDVDLCLRVEKIEEINDKEFFPKVLAYDIETDDLQIGKGEILMISLVSKNFKKVITWKTPTQNSIIPEYVEVVKDETELLESFVKYVKKVSPDFLVGYFSDGFDLPYIKSRADKFNIKLDIGLDGSVPKFSRGINLTGRINGIVHVDILKFIKTAYAQYMQSETLTLNQVAKEFLGDKKKDFKLKHSSKIKDDWSSYYEYNLHDSVLTYNLFEKFYPDILEFVLTIKEPVFEVSRNGLSKYMENYILHNLDKFNEIPEKRPTYNEIGDRRHSESVGGAFVYEPKPGIYENIVVFDFTSMHTSIIISMNLSKSTLLSKKKKNSIETPEIDFDGKRVRFYFSRDLGFFPSLMKDIFAKRKQFKEEYKKNPNKFTLARSNAFKVLSASAHGYIGFFGARYYSKETSASVLAYVRKFNQEIIEKVKKNNFEVIFADTDSVAFVMRDKTKSEIKDFLKKLNKDLPGVMKLDLDGFFRRGIWVKTRSKTTGAKKKYAMIDYNNELKIRGFETVRHDWCNLARNLQKKIIYSILKTGNEKDSIKIVKQVVDDVKKRKVEKDDLIIKTQLKKSISEYKSISPHVIAARKMKEQNIAIEQGGLIEYYIGETKTKSKLVRDKVKLPNEQGDYDINYYLEKQVTPAVENLLEVFDVNINEIIEGKRQMTLGDF